MAVDFETDYILSKYQEVSLLSASGKNKVFTVLDSSTDRIFIKKELPKETNLDVYKQMRSIDFKNVPKIHHILEGDERNYLIEEYISGVSLEYMLKNHKKIDASQVVVWITALCDILKQFHESRPSIVHRDIKPTNIVITDDGTLKLIDFDISRIYKDDSEKDTRMFGTDYYAAPEQFGFAQTDNRTDIYAIGKLMIVLLTGKQRKIDSELNKFGALKQVIERCCAIDPESRYQNVSELEMALFPKKKASVKKRKAGLNRYLF